MSHKAHSSKGAGRSSLLPPGPAPHKKAKRGRHPGGRPTAYRGDVTVKAVLAFAAGLTVRNFRRRCAKAHLGVLLGVDEETVRNWEKEYPEFFGAIKTWETKRNAVFFDFAKWTDARWIFCAKNWTGMHDRQQLEHTGEIRGRVEIRVITAVPRPPKEPAK